VKVFLDASVLLAAAGSPMGGSAAILDRRGASGWTLQASPYVLGEVERNLDLMPAGAEARWQRLRGEIAVVRDILTLDRPVVFAPAKDRPVLFSALAWSDVLLTLDAADFAGLLGSSFYGLEILTPGDLLRLA